MSDRLSGLGAAKWAVHVEGLARAAAGQAVTFLSIGEPDLPPPASVLDQAVASMRGGRLKYASDKANKLHLMQLPLTCRAGLAKKFHPSKLCTPQEHKTVCAPC